jgi:hypothetical protein
MACTIDGIDAGILSRPGSARPEFWSDFHDRLAARSVFLIAPAMPARRAAPDDPATIPTGASNFFAAMREVLGAATKWPDPSEDRQGPAEFDIVIWI